MRARNGVAPFLLAGGIDELNADRQETPEWYTEPHEARAFLQKAADGLLAERFPEATIRHVPELNRVALYRLRKQGVPEALYRASGPE